MGAQPPLFGRLMAGAVSMIFFTYAFVNMGMVSGILPVVGAAALCQLRGTAMVTLGWRWAFSCRWRGRSEPGATRPECTAVAAVPVFAGL